MKTLLVLERLMYYIRPSDNPLELPRPCDVFNCIVGNGSGGLVALFLGRFRMTVAACLRHYSNLLLCVQKNERRKGPTVAATAMARFAPGDSGSSGKPRTKITVAALPNEESYAKFLQFSPFPKEVFTREIRDQKPSKEYSRSKKSTEPLEESDQTFEHNLDLEFSFKSMTQ